jgi:hypothetical protein
MCAGKPNTQPLALSADPFDKGNTLSNVAPRSGMKTRMKIRSLGGVARDAGVGPPSHTTQPEGLTGPRPCQEISEVSSQEVNSQKTHRFSTDLPLGRFLFARW